MSSLLESLLKKRIWMVVILHLIFSVASLTLSFMLRFDFTLGGEIHKPLFINSLPINVVVFVLFSAIFNLFQGIWRYVSIDDLKDIVKTSAVSTLVFMAVIVLSGKFKGYPRSIYLLDFILFIILNGGTRFTIRLFREAFVPMSETAKNVIIVGAGSAGNELAKSLKSAKKREYVPIAFIDKDSSTHGKRLQGIRVVGGLKSLKQTILKHRVREVFIAIPEATNKQVKEIMDVAKIKDWDLKFKISPSLLDIMSGKLKVSQIQDVSINDLLSRPNIKLDDEYVRNSIAGKSVLITGAGGSIGSELAFQVAAYSPARIIILDASEENAYKIDRYLKKAHRNIAINSVVGSVLDTSIVEGIFRRYNIDFVFHAAAYKHVHLMEWSPLASLKNNVLGTASIASISEKNGVGQFVMISTDKAVNPRGMMGLSKRLAERVILERHGSATKFNVVRFGNVLGSSGSVIPLFKKQILDGGPVTVTSEETRRFFMSIPEAVQLVLQAASLGERNTIFMLEMGEPVKIIDLAKNLIELSGLKVGDDIEIEIVGMRPGEKIVEELLTADENLLHTKFEKIRMQKNTNYNPDLVNDFLHRLSSNIDLGDIEAIYSDLKNMVPEMIGPSYEELKENMFS